MSKASHRCAAIFVMSVVAACGGGGGDSATSTQPAAAPAQVALGTAWKNLTTVGGSWALSARAADGSTVNITISAAKGADESLTLSGTTTGPFSTADLTTTSKIAGITTSTDTTHVLLDMTCLRIFGPLIPGGRLGWELVAVRDAAC